MSRLSRIEHPLKWMNLVAFTVILLIGILNMKWSFGYGSSDEGIIVDCGCIVHGRWEHVGTQENLEKYRKKEPFRPPKWLWFPGAYRRTIGSFEATIYSFFSTPETSHDSGYWPAGNGEWVVSTVTRVVFPLWLLLLVACVPMPFFWRHELRNLLEWFGLRRHRPGHCQTCGYNLTGNVSGICPECGTAVGGETSARSRGCNGTSSR